MEYVLLGSVIVGVTELLKRLRAKDFWAAATITTAALIGVAFGMAGFEGLDPMSGLVAGFAATGAVAGIGSFGRRSVPQETKAI